LHEYWVLGIFKVGIPIIEVEIDRKEKNFSSTPENYVEVMHVFPESV
jgi:hypothetical protein